MDDNKKIKDIRFSEITIRDVKHVLNVIAKYTMVCFIVNCVIGAVASVVLLIMEFSTHWLSDDMGGTKMYQYLVVGTFVFTTLFYTGLSYVSYKGFIYFKGLVLTRNVWKTQVKSFNAEDVGNSASHLPK